MAKRAIYEELDEAVNRLLIGEASADHDGLLATAAELKQMPSMEFRLRLKSDLEDHAMFLAAGRKYQRPMTTGRILQMPKPLFASVAATYPVHSRNFAMSVGLHVVVLALLVSSGAWFVHKEQVKSGLEAVLVDPGAYVLTVAPKEAGGGGGGGDQDKIEASQGRLPKQAMQQITPPAVVIRLGTSGARGRAHGGSAADQHGVEPAEPWRSNG